MKHTYYGFSTGALEKGAFKKAMDWMVNQNIRALELSALRIEELKPLIGMLPNLNLREFDYVSFHAPSAFTDDQEDEVIQCLKQVSGYVNYIVVHPDVLYHVEKWKSVQEFLLIENMDRRKTVGKDVRQLKQLFEQLPQARLCLDLAHARQLDTTLTLLRNLISTFITRIAEIHISELDSRCRHRRMTQLALEDYRQISKPLCNIPVIVESMLDTSSGTSRQNELRSAQYAMKQEQM